ncbi:hypothetical protein ACFV3R_04480 [Streptomyces sp. NPDC059740]|uniref:hypothetical protein n=1 Tax=Streptomyces sp. NPDC059740 TaxID=3346926 RepID=UPI003666A088
MAQYVVSVPGTFLRPLTEDARRRVLAAVRGADPDEVGDVPLDLDALSVEDEGRFVLRLEVAADNSPAAQEAALTMARGALAAAGYDEDGAATGQAVITAIDAG